MQRPLLNSLPHILITNDDGIHAPGLRALVDALKEDAKITVVAPSHERSASAQALTLRQPIYMDQIAANEYSIEGTPADAVILAFNAILPEKPDLVVSGINRGANMGENIYYSGTVGAAMEGAINRVPSIAISVAYRSKEIDFRPAAEFARSLIPIVLTEKLPPGILLNVNVPQIWKGPVRFTKQSSKITRNLLQPGTDPRGRKYFWPRCATEPSPLPPSNSITLTSRRSNTFPTGPIFSRPSSSASRAARPRVIGHRISSMFSYGESPQHTTPMLASLAKREPQRVHFKTGVMFLCHGHFF